MSKTRTMTAHVRATAVELVGLAAEVLAGHRGSILHALIDLGPQLDKAIDNARVLGLGERMSLSAWVMLRQAAMMAAGGRPETHERWRRIGEALRALVESELPAIDGVANVSEQGRGQ